jgi:hypothetical protein
MLCGDKNRLTQGKTKGLHRSRPRHRIVDGAVVSYAAWSTESLGVVGRTNFKCSNTLNVSLQPKMLSKVAIWPLCYALVTPSA